VGLSGSNRSSFEALAREITTMMNVIQSSPAPSPASATALHPAASGEALPQSGGPSAWRVFRALVELQKSGPTEAVQKAARLSELCRSVCDMHRIEVELRGKLPSTPAIIVANHLGYIDPIVLCSLLPLSPIAKSEISDWALVGVPLERLNVSFVRRGDAWSGARVLLRSIDTLRAGVSILNFPEGTTSRGGLLPFHLGAFWLALHTGVPIVPVAIDFEDMGLCWVDREAFLPHYAKVWCMAGSRRVRVSVGAPLLPREYRSVLDLSWAAQKSIASHRCSYSSDVVVER
jgi:1-acyl-sn-glycerol-3-phosphate acyltransferase